MYVTVFIYCHICSHIVGVGVGVLPSSIFGKQSFFIIGRTAKRYLGLGHLELQGGREIRPRKVCRGEEIVTNFIFKAPSKLRMHGRNGRGLQILSNGRSLRLGTVFKTFYYLILGSG